jgi:putative salt-induced outer membrane protein
MKKILMMTAAAGLLMSADPAGTMKQAVELGYMGSTGNTDSQSVNALYRNDYQYDSATDMHLKADLLYGEKSGETSDERYRLFTSMNHYYDEDLFAYAEASALRNTFEGYNQQYNLGAGLGYNIFKDPKQSLKGKAGLQYRRSNFTDEPHDNFYYAKAGLDYLYNFSETNQFTAQWNVLDNLKRVKDYETVVDLGLKMLIVDQLSFRLGFELKYDNVPPVGKKKTDTTTTAGIVYNF